MVDLEHLKSLGICHEQYKEYFSRPIQDMPESHQKLVRLINSRITDSRRLNLTDWRTYAAVDLAYDTPFAQTTPTIVRSILGRHLDSAGVRGALANYGISEDELFIPGTVRDKDGVDHEVKILNPPVAIKILLPIVRAVTSIRLGKLFNDMNVRPFLQYPPLRTTNESQVACEIITDVVDEISTQFGYPSVLRQGIMQMLKYGTAFAFPLEEWYTERQVLGGETVTTKQGIRYYWPHPTRMNFDGMYPATSFNTDTGCEWALYWRVIPYREVLRSEFYWNRDSIFQGTNWFAFPGAAGFFEEVYPCQFMTPLPGGAYQVTEQLREDKQYWYTTNTEDRACFITETFMKLAPKRWGLGNYDHPVWHQFTVAGDDNVIFAHPCGYDPVWFLGYDYDEQAATQVSLGLEAIPWQDEVENVLNQIIEHSKENLATIIFYNELAVNQDDIKKVEKAGNKKYTDKLFIGYDPKQMAAAKINMGEVFQKVDLGGKPVVELLQVLPIIIQMMERLLQISAQEAGASASHQQSKKEVELSSGGSLNRVNYIRSFVLEGRAAWMRQLHAASMAHMKGDIEAEIPDNIPDLDKILPKIGFEKSGEGDGTIVVKGDRKALMLQRFADTSKFPDPSRDKEMAQAMFNCIGIISGKEFLQQQMRPADMLTLIEIATKLAGGPADLRLRVDPEAENKGDVPDNVKKAIEEAMQGLEQKIATSLAQPVAKEMAEDKQEIQQIQQALKQIQQVVEQYKASQDKLKLRAEETQQRMQIRDAEFQADQRRKDEAHQADLSRESQAHNLDIAHESSRTQSDITNDATKTQAAMAIAAAKASQQGGQ